MALIRLAGHFIDNPNHIDKLISIKGLPKEWFFRPSKFGGEELVPPWKPDVEANIPHSIRHLCEEMDITVPFPPIEKGRDSVVDKIKIIGLKLDFTSGPGQEMWEKIERYLDRMTPRDQRVPKPVLCAPNQKAEFSPHEARRTVRGSLELRPCEIPDVDLRESVTAKSVTAVVQEVAQVIVEKPPVIECKPCNKIFSHQKYMDLHLNKSKAHNPSLKIKEKVGV